MKNAYNLGLSSSGSFADARAVFESRTARLTGQASVLVAKDNRRATDADWKFRQDASRFAGTGYEIRGELSSHLLQRAVANEITIVKLDGSVQCVAAGADKRAGFEVAISGTVGLTCQSCGVEFEFPLDCRSVIHVATDAAELAGWDDEAFDSIEATEKTSALDLVEDELLLSVPYVPRCARCENGSTPRTYEFN